MAIAGYQTLHLIAHSYLGSLWIALDQRNGAPGKPVLVRRIQRTEQTRSEALQRMACAGRDAMALSHENVLPVLDVVLQVSPGPGPAGDSLALAYEYVEAEPLRALQSLARERGLGFPVEVSLRLCIDLLRGVRALHGTLLGWPSAPPFGGLSPDSILVSRDGRTRLCDPLVASCATLLEGMSLNVAKLAYTAPEQAYATAPLAATSDIFSCGVLLWELLAGSCLLTGSRPTVERKLLEHDLPNLRLQLRNDRALSDRLLALVERCLASDAGRRPQTPAELASELEQCGHEVASLGQVAAFVGELAGASFDQRRMTVRSLPSLRAPQGRPSGASPALGRASGGRRVPLPADVSGSDATFRSPVSSLALGAAASPGRASRRRVPLPDRPAFARLALPIAPQLVQVASAAHGEARPAAPPVAAAPPVELAVEAAPPAAAAPLAAPPAKLAVAAAAPVAPPVAAAPLAELAVAPRSVESPFAASRAESAGAAPSAQSPSPPAPRAEAAPVATPSVATPSVATPPVEPPPVEPPRLSPAGTRTMVGLAVPPLPLRANQPFDSVLPSAVIPNASLSTSTSSDAVVVIPPDPFARASSSAPPSLPPLSVGSLVPTLRPSAPELGAGLISKSLPSAPAGAIHRRVNGWSQAPGVASIRKPLGRAAFASVLALLTLAGVVGSALLLRPAPHGSGASLASAPAASRDSTGLPQPRAAAVQAAPRAPPPLADLADGGSGEPADAGAMPASAGRAAASAAVLVVAPTSFDVAARELQDAELRLLFALERRVQLPSCAERLGSSARLHTGAAPDKSQAQLQAARRELLRGNNAEAQRLLCSATAHFPNNVAAWQTLAELALHLGDGEHARQAIEQALKRRPNDSTLLGLQGDSAALLGDLAQSRALWAKSLHVSARDPQSTRRLAQQFASIAARRLHDWSYGAALVQYRRAAVLSRGDAELSAGMGEVLRLLAQPQAALAWADRAAARARR